MSDQKPQDTELAKKPVPAQLVAHDDSEFANLLDTGKFQQMFKAASLFAQSQLIPVQYQNKPANCFVALQMAVRLGVDPMMFMQNTYVVHSKPAMEAKLKIALINKNGPFNDPIQWVFEGEGDNRKCTAFGILESGTKCEATVTMKMVKAEGWIKNPKWVNMPDLMFRYRSAAFLGNLYCPDVLMGMQSVDEVTDVGEETVPFEDASVTAQAMIEDQAGSQVTDAAFEDQSQEQPQEDSADDESWLEDN
jgi:hypothetical protein